MDLVVRGNGALIRLNNMKVDIIIPVHNRWEHTKQTLDSLILNTDKKLYSLYVINDKSDEDTSQNLEEYQKKSKTSFTLTHNTENIGPGASRNFVCDMITKRNERGDYLYHSDNDVYFKSGWLPLLLIIYQRVYDSVKLLGASCHPYLQNKESIIFEGQLSKFRVGIKDAVSGYSQLMTWEIWDMYGPFDETMRGAGKKIMGSEDWAFCQSINKHGLKVGSVEPELVVPCGKTNTYGDPATGSETFKEYDGVMVQ